MPPPEPGRLQDLLARARAGDKAAVEELLASHRQTLHRMIALRLDPALRARLDASDVVQDVLIEANRRLQDYLRSPALPFPLWLRQIAKDQIIDAHRKHRKAQRRSLDREQPLVDANASGSDADLMGQLRDPDVTPATAAVRHELQEHIDAAVLTLEEADQEILKLRLYDQSSNQEVAARLGVSEPAASMRFLRAMRRLHTVLARDLSKP